MGRHKKNESAVLVQLVDRFFETEAMGDVRRLKYSNLARYAEAQGVHAAWYDFQRDKAVVRHIEELHKLSPSTDSPTTVAAYKSMDIEALLNNCRTMEDLKRKLYELDCYWKKAYDDSVRAANHNRDIIARAQEMEQKLDALSEASEASERQMNALRRENAYLRRMLRENLYPAIANELLRENHLPAAENETVRPDAFPHLIEGGVPQPLNGVQQPQQKKLSRQEQLLADMRRQVKEHGE